MRHGIHLKLRGVLLALTLAGRPAPQAAQSHPGQLVILVKGYEVEEQYKSLHCGRNAEEVGEDYAESENRTQSKDPRDAE